MTRPDPYSYPPRGLSRQAAARYIGLGASTFDGLIEEGRMPKPLRVGKRTIWDRLKVDAAFTELGEESDENLIDRAVRLARGSQRWIYADAIPASDALLRPSGSTAFRLAGQSTSRPTIACETLSHQD